MVLLLTLVLVGLMSRAHATAEGTFTKDEEKKCNTVASTYIAVSFPDATLNNTNQGIKVKPSTYQTQPCLIYPYHPDQYYSIYFFCVTGDACTKKELLLWHIRNVLNSKLKDGDTHIKYTPPKLKEETQRCVFIVGQQCKKLPACQTDQDPKEFDIPQLIMDDGVVVNAATYFQTEKLDHPPTKEPCKDPKEPKKPCNPLLHILSGLL